MTSTISIILTVVTDSKVTCPFMCIIKLLSTNMYSELYSEKKSNC